MHAKTSARTTGAALLASAATHGVVLVVLAVATFEPAARLAPFGSRVEFAFDVAGEGAAPEIPESPELVIPEPQSGPVAPTETTSSAAASRPSSRRAVPRAARERPATPEAPVHAGSGLPELLREVPSRQAQVPDEPIADDPGPQRPDGTGRFATSLAASAPGPAGSTPSSAELVAAVAGLDLSRCIPGPGLAAGQRRGMSVRVHVTYRGATGRPRFAGIMHVPFAGTPEGACICRELTARAQVRPFPAERADIVYQLDL